MEKKKRKKAVDESEKYILPAEGFVRLPAVLRALANMSESTWWAGVKAGRYPKGVKLGPNITAWPVEEIRELMDKAKNAR